MMRQASDLEVINNPIRKCFIVDTIFIKLIQKIFFELRSHISNCQTIINRDWIKQALVISTFDDIPALSIKRKQFLTLVKDIEKHGGAGAGAAYYDNGIFDRHSGYFSIKAVEPWLWLRSLCSLLAFALQALWMRFAASCSAQRQKRQGAERPQAANKVSATRHL